MPDGAAVRVGVVGVGRMGRPMALAMGRAGLGVRVFDLSPAAVAAAAADGLEVAGSLAELATSADIVVTVLPDGGAVAAAVGDPGDAQDSLLGGRPVGLFLVDMSSSAPAGTLALHARLIARGGRLVDAPVSGGVVRAVEADLAVMAGGAPADVDACEPVLRAVGSTVFRTGGVGSGHAMKALNNLLSATNLAAAVEVLLLGRQAGLDPSTMLEVLNASTGRSQATELKLPRYVVPAAYDSGFSLDLMVKDLGIAMGVAAVHDLEPKVVGAAAGVWRAAAADLGPGRDHTEVARWLQATMGVELDG